MMALILRPTGLGAGIDKDRPDYTIYSGGWAVGRIYEVRGGPDTRHRPLTVIDQNALQSRGHPRRGQGAVSEELGRLEGVGEAGRGTVEHQAR